MRKGHISYFLLNIFGGEDIEFSYNGTTYWFQGYTVQDGFVMDLIQIDPPVDGFVWKFRGRDSQECFDAFLDAPLFDNLSILAVQSDIAWLG